MKRRVILSAMIDHVRYDDELKQKIVSPLDIIPSSFKPMVITKKDEQLELVINLYENFLALSELFDKYRMADVNHLNFFVLSESRHILYLHDIEWRCRTNMNSWHVFLVAPALYQETVNKLGNLKSCKIIAVDEKTDFNEILLTLAEDYIKTNSQFVPSVEQEPTFKQLHNIDKRLILSPHELESTCQYPSCRSLVQINLDLMASNFNFRSVLMFSYFSEISKKAAQRGDISLLEFLYSNFPYLGYLPPAPTAKEYYEKYLQVFDETAKKEDIDFGFVSLYRYNPWGRDLFPLPPRAPLKIDTLWRIDTPWENIYIYLQDPDNAFTFYTNIMQQFGEIYSCLKANKLLIRSFSLLQAPEIKTRFIKHLLLKPKTFKNIRLEESSFTESIVYNYFLKAIEDDYPDQAQICLDCFRENNIPIQEILNNNVLFDILTHHESFRVLKLFLKTKDTRLIIKEFILNEKILKTPVLGTFVDLLLPMFIDDEQQIDENEFNKRIILYELSNSYILMSSLNTILNLLIDVNSKTIGNKPEQLRLKLGESIRAIFPEAKVLKRYYFPTTNRLPFKSPYKDANEVLAIPNYHGIQLKYIVSKFDFRTQYVFEKTSFNQPLYLTLTPYGVLRISLNNHPVQKILFENGLLQLDQFYFSSQKISLLNPDSPKVQTQTPYIQHGNKKKLTPIGKGLHGFWASTNQDRKKIYDVIVSGCCIFGLSFKAVAYDKTGKVVQTLMLTDPKAEIPESFKADALLVDKELHPYENYTIAQFRVLLSNLNRESTPNAPVYFDLPRINYILYGIHYYITGVLTRDLLIQYINIVDQRFRDMRLKLNELEDEFYRKIITTSTLEDLYLFSRLPESMVDSIDSIIQDIDQELKEQQLVESLLADLKEIQAPTGRIYSSLDPNEVINTLLDLSRIDYAALYAKVKLLHPEEDILGILPLDEEQIFSQYKTLFRNRFGELDTRVWLPTIIATGEDKTRSKLFFQSKETGSKETNELINSEIVDLLAMAIAALSQNLPDLYIYAYSQIAKTLTEHEAKYNPKQMPGPNG